MCLMTAESIRLPCANSAIQRLRETDARTEMADLGMNECQAVGGVAVAKTQVSADIVENARCGSTTCKISNED